MLMNDYWKEMDQKDAMQEAIEADKIIGSDLKKSGSNRRDFAEA